MKNKIKMEGTGERKFKKNKKTRSWKEGKELEGVEKNSRTSENTPEFSKKGNKRSEDSCNFWP